MNGAWVVSGYEGGTDYIFQTEEAEQQRVIAEQPEKLTVTFSGHTLGTR